MPPIKGRGRKLGDGENIRLLTDMAIGDSLWDISKGKMESLRSSASHIGIKILVRRIPGTDVYAIQKMANEPSEPCQ